MYIPGDIFLFLGLIGIIKILEWRENRIKNNDKKLHHLDGTSEWK